MDGLFTPFYPLFLTFFFFLLLSDARYFNTEVDFTGVARPQSELPALQFRGWDGFTGSVGATIAAPVLVGVPGSAFAGTVTRSTVVVYSEVNGPIINASGLESDTVCG